MPELVEKRAESVAARAVLTLRAAPSIISGMTHKARLRRLDNRAIFPQAFAVLAAQL